MKKIFFTMLIISVLFLTGCPESSGPGKDVLVIGMSQQFESLDPYTSEMAAASYIRGFVHRSLIRFDENWELASSLSKEVPTLENGLAEIYEKGGKKFIKLTYEIKDNAKWGDGTPITTDDFIMAWKIGKEEMVRVGSRENYTNIVEIEKLSDKKFVMHNKKVDYQYNRQTEDWFKAVPAHLMEKIFDTPLTSPEDYNKRTPYNTDSLNPGLYNGPYLVTKVVSGDYMILEPNPHFYGQQPKIKKIILRLIHDTATLENSIIAGSVHFIPGEAGNLSVDQGISFEKRHGDKFDVIFKSGLFYEHMDVNHQSPILKDKRVRQALMYGIDREKINEQIFKGKLKISHTDVSPLDSVYCDDIVKYKYDQEKAIALLEGAGWTEKRQEQGQMVRYNSKGDRLELVLMTTAQNKTRELVQQILQEQWKQLGFIVTIKNQPAEVYFGQTIKEGKFEGLALFAWVSSPENISKTTMHSSNIPTKENGYQGQNSGRYNNPKMDEIIEKCELELNDEKRLEHWKAFQKHYAEDLPALPLYSRANIYIIPKWLKGIKPTGHQYASSYKCEEWEIDASLRN